MKKKAKIILIAFVVVVLSVTAIFTAGSARSKDHAGLLFRAYRQEFETAALSLLNGESPKSPAGVRDMRRCGPDKSCVDFYMGGRGIVPSSTYWGVIYTAEDRPVGFQGVAQEYTPDGDGWVWREKNGDNTERVTKLDDHWYLYEASF